MAPLKEIVGHQLMHSFIYVLFYFQLEDIIYFSFCMQLALVVNQGKLLSDEIIFSLLSKRLEAREANSESGFILDGFPRTIRQAVSTCTKS